MSDSLAQLISTFPTFTGFTSSGAESLLELGEQKEHQTGEVLFREGDAASAVLLVLTGRLQIFVVRNQHDLVLKDSGPGSIVGELAVLCGIPRSASVRAADRSTVLHWSAPAFRRLLLGDPFLSQRILGESLRTLIDKERSLIDSLLASKTR